MAGKKKGKDLTPAEKYAHLIEGHDVWGALQEFVMGCDDEAALTELYELEKETHNRRSHLARILARRRYVRKKHEMEELESN